MSEIEFSMCWLPSGKIGHGFFSSLRIKNTFVALQSLTGIFLVYIFTAIYTEVLSSISFQGISKFSRLLLMR
uniref:Putative ovule protein n=1 Tax=Solanum chacoense TaxID=4108 RepID=A0A0V0H350_SOLCH